MYGDRMCRGKGLGHWTDGLVESRAVPVGRKDRLKSRGIGFLYRLTSETGGTLYLPKSIDELPDVYRHILFTLRNQYLIEYYAGSFPYEGVLERQFRIAQRVMTGRQGKLLFLPGFPAPERAVPMFRKIVENAPNWKKAPEAQYLVGVILEGNGEYAEAIAQLKECCAVDPEDHGAKYNLGVAYELTGKLEEAKKCYIAAYLMDDKDYYLASLDRVKSRLAAVGK